MPTSQMMHTPRAFNEQSDVSFQDEQDLLALKVPIPFNEFDRIRFLREARIFDTSEEETYDRQAAFARRVFKTPIAIISLVDISRQWFKAKIGLAASETHRDHAFCAYTILEDSPDVVVVLDASKDERFHNNPLVVGFPFIRFYAGAALIIDGVKVGTLCIIDSQARNSFSERDASILRDMALIVSDSLSERRNKFIETSRDMAHMSTSLLSMIQKPLQQVLYKHEPLQSMMNDMQMVSSHLPLTSFLHACLQFTEQLEILHDMIEASLHVVTRVFDIEQHKHRSAGFLPCSVHDLLHKVKTSLTRCSPHFNLDWYINPYVGDNSLKQAMLQGKSPSQARSRNASLMLSATPTRSFVSHPDILHLVLTSLLWDLADTDRQMTNITVSCEESQCVQLTEAQAFNLLCRTRGQTPRHIGKIQTSWVTGSLIVTATVKTSSTAKVSPKQDAWRTKLQAIAHILSWVQGHVDVEEVQYVSSAIDELSESFDMEDHVLERIVIKVPCMVEQDMTAPVNPAQAASSSRFTPSAPVFPTTSPSCTVKATDLHTSSSTMDMDSSYSALISTFNSSTDMQDYLPQDTVLKPRRRSQDQLDQQHVAWAISNKPMQHTSRGIRNICKEIAIGMWRRVATVHIDRNIPTTMHHDK